MVNIERELVELVTAGSRINMTAIMNIIGEKGTIKENMKNSHGDIGVKSIYMKCLSIEIEEKYARILPTLKENEIEHFITLSKRFDC